MRSDNKHIEKFLEYYYSFDKSPEYAVLLKGGWGAGKTWFIKKSLEKLENNKGKYLYISLYGVRNTSEVEDEIFKQLHPILSSKTLGIAGKLAKSLLKTTIKLDLDSDDKADASVSSQIPDIDLSKYITSTEGYILVFDDLERCSINIVDILGYINYFIEHLGYKVVVLANEERLLEKNGNNYKETKEKLIGKTFEISPDLSSALASFTDSISDKYTQEICINNSVVISALFRASNYQNLRHLKQSFWDFERFCLGLSEKTKVKKELILHLLKLFICFSFEIKNGNILPEDIQKLPSGLVAKVLRQQDNKEKNIYNELSNKYNEVDFSDLLLEESTWVNILGRGYFDQESIEIQLSKSTHFNDENTPDWKRLWFYHERTDEDFDKYLNTVSDEFYQMTHKELGVVKHLVGLFLHLSEEKLFNKSKSEILNFSMKYIDTLKEEGFLPINESNRSIVAYEESWDGLGFMGKGIKEYDDFLTYAEVKRLEITKGNYPDIGLELLNHMKNDIRKYYAWLTLCHLDQENCTDNIYFDTPILSYIDPKDFVSTFIKIKPADMSMVFYALVNRYQFPDYREKLKSELTWLKKVKSILEEEAIKAQGKVSGHRFNSFIKGELTQIIDGFKSNKSLK